MWSRWIYKSVIVCISQFICSRKKIIIAGGLLERRLKKVSGFAGRESNPVLSHTSRALLPTLLRSLVLVARQILKGSNPVEAWIFLRFLCNCSSLARIISARCLFGGQMKIFTSQVLFHWYPSVKICFVFFTRLLSSSACFLKWNGENKAAIIPQGQSTYLGLQF